MVELSHSTFFQSRNYAQNFHLGCFHYVLPGGGGEEDFSGG